MKVFLEGKTLKGRNRIREHGNVWEVAIVQQEVIFSYNPGPWWLVQAPDGHSRWIHSLEDEHFKVLRSEG